MKNNTYKWFAGVPHCHTVASDGKLTLEQVIAKAKKNKLDFLMITDHNENCKNDLPVVEGLTLIYGAELTKHGGHCNMWGVKDVIDLEDYKTCETYEDFLRVKNKAKERGAVICMNHPHCKQCPWRWEMNAADVDVLEVWNAPTHYDNLECTEWWHEQLRAGHKLPVVGGSDYHQDYVITNMIAWPVTYVYAKSNSAEDILDAIVKGRTTINFAPGTTFIDIVSGDAMLGDTVKINEDTSVTINVKKLNKNHTLIVFDADGECFRYKADKKRDYSVTLPVKKSGFICAHTVFEPGFIYHKLHDYALASRIPEQKGMKLPPLIFAQSGAIYFEK